MYATCNKFDKLVFEVSDGVIDFTVNGNFDPQYADPAKNPVYALRWFITQVKSAQSTHKKLVAYLLLSRERDWRIRVLTLLGFKPHPKCPKLYQWYK